MMKQIRFLHTTDLGFEFRNTALISLHPVSDVQALEHRIRQLPEITDMLFGTQALIPRRGFYITTITEWDDMPPDAGAMHPETKDISKHIIDFYHLRFVEGEFTEDENASLQNVWINETLARQLGWNKSTGKKMKDYNDIVTVRGVIKDIHTSPKEPVRPVIFTQRDNFFTGNNVSKSIVIKYQEGQWKSCKAKIEQLAREEYPDASLEIENAENTFDGYMRSETALITLLMCVSLICIIISVFGLFSLVALSCERRQKEIAIRKINGATVKDILDMYFKEYLLLLFIGAIVAFPVSYLMMKTWLEQYVKQTAISAWIYIAILLLLAMIIVMCIGWRVYRAAKSNPAEEIRK
jgi:ABC-type antimicrobial peptide transport system permease subunit